MRKTETIRTKLVENMSNSKDFWKYILKIDSVSMPFSNTIDQAVGSERVSEIFLTKYKSLFNSVPTCDITDRINCSFCYQLCLMQCCSGVYNCLIDAGNAFDRVYWGKHFSTQIEKNVSFIFIRLIFDSYTS